MDLYDFGFGGFIEVPSFFKPGRIRRMHKLILHVTCRFKIIHRVGVKCIDRYYEDTPCEEFHTNIQSLIGLTVKRVGLSDKNDSWLDFGDYWIAFATFETNEESWRYFTWDNFDPHLVAADTWLEFHHALPQDTQSSAGCGT